ncbi:MAG: single-stranded DNA-binding protein [Actinomycetota bacterium]|nr:single-stranded DNA-binding protein [Actinomycetota bacterium]MDQ3734216.1 single-stranded DNA-binding protein [Actinomycetota bacterium]
MSLSIVETNEVHLIGRLHGQPTPKTLPDGEAAVGFRLSVSRPPELIRRQKSDFIDCVCSRAATIKAAAGWVPGDVLELNGALHHRFWRVGPSTVNVYEVEVRTVRRVSRAPAKKPGRRSKAAAGALG